MDPTGKVEQLALIPPAREEIVADLVEALRRYGAHTLYCAWRDGRYQPELGCTCGLADAIAEGERHVGKRSE